MWNDSVTSEMLHYQELCHEAGVSYTRRLPVEGYRDVHFTAFNMVSTHVPTGRKFYSVVYIYNTGAAARSEFHTLLLHWSVTDQWKYNENTDPTKQPPENVYRSLEFLDCGCMI